MAHTLFEKLQKKGNSPFSEENLSVTGETISDLEVTKEVHGPYKLYVVYHKNDPKRRYYFDEFYDRRYVFDDGTVSLKILPVKES